MNKIMYLNGSKKEKMSLYVHVMSHPEPGDTYTCFLSYSTQAVPCRFNEQIKVRQRAVVELTHLLAWTGRELYSCYNNDSLSMDVCARGFVC